MPDIEKATSKAQEIAAEQTQTVKRGTSEDGIRVAAPGGQPHPNSQQAINLSSEMLTNAVRGYKGAMADLDKSMRYYVTTQRMAGLSNEQIMANKTFAEAVELADAIDGFMEGEEDSPGEALMAKTKLVGPGHENDDNEAKPDPEKRMEGGALVPPTEDVTTAMKPVGQGDSSLGQGISQAESGKAASPVEEVDSEDGLPGDGQPH